MPKLCGISIAKNVIKFDYCIKESILSMLEVCDYVVVAYVESEDNTLELLESINSQRLEILHLTEKDWNFYNDKNRLNYITNIAIQHADRLGFEYVLYVQADEVLHESSYESVRRAMQNNAEAYMVSRVNLWKSPDLELNVEPHRLPCSNYVIRLAKSNYRTYDDAESIGALADFGFVEQIKIIHYGFVRKKEVMKSKIINMQESVFGISHDPKLDECEIFNPDLWFNPETDLKPITFEHPAIMVDWVNERK